MADRNLEGKESSPPIGVAPTLQAYGEALQAWLDAERDALAAFREPPPEAFEERVAMIRGLQRALFDAGWARYGWPEALGGFGGTVLHRAAMIDALSRNGYPPRYILEHLEILPPALQKFAPPELLERVFLPSIRSDLIWCQGFSEPSAGSDLAALKTRATEVEGGYRIDGHKIWTSWAKYADLCLVVARTGTPEDRHRGLSAFVVPLDSPGITVSPIRQANGTDELAEVFFEEVFVPSGQRVGEANQGWAVAMEILAGERGSYGWLRHTHQLERLEHLASQPAAVEQPRALGRMLVHLLALRCRSREVMEILAEGGTPGPESSVSKVLVIDADNALYETAREVLEPALDLGLLPESWEWQESYLYSRASGIYGGTRQIQLNVIAKGMVKAGRSYHRSHGGPELEAVRENVVRAAEQSASAREALEGLDFHSFAAAPEDGLGRAAFAAWFEQQGAALGTSPVLSAVAAGALAEARGIPADRVAVAVAGAGTEFAPPGSGERELHAIGWDDRTGWLAAPGNGGTWELAPAADARVAPWHALDPALGVRVALPSASFEDVALDADAAERSLALARLGASFEILGAAGAVTDLVVHYSNQREQFGQPISAFQAVQHMLSECQVHLASIASLADAALEQWSAGGGIEASRAAKAIAGRAGRQVVQHTLQCFGAISFTDEHPHHRFLRRIHTLDAVLGSMYEWETRLGRDLLESGRAPRCVEVWRPAGE